jgi:hypothetical protein
MKKIYQKPVMLPVAVKEQLDDMLIKVNDLRDSKGMVRLSRGDLISRALRKYNVNHGAK